MNPLSYVNNWMNSATDWMLYHPASGNEYMCGAAALAGGIHAYIVNGDEKALATSMGVALYCASIGYFLFHKIEDKRQEAWQAYISQKKSRNASSPTSV